MKPYFGYVLIENIERKDIDAGGFKIPSQVSLKKGTIKELPPLKKLDNGEEEYLALNVGDIVHFENEPIQIILDGVNCSLISTNSIIAKESK